MELNMFVNMQEEGGVFSVENDKINPHTVEKRSIGNRKLIANIFYTFVKKNRKSLNRTLAGMVLWGLLCLWASAKLEAVQK